MFLKWQLMVKYFVLSYSIDVVSTLSYEMILTVDIYLVVIIQVLFKFDVNA